MPQKYDINEPILVLIRRGRKGRGFTVCPVEDISNPAVCSDAPELGEVIEEMLNDESQPRVDVNELMNASTEPEPEPSGPQQRRRTRAQPEEVEEEEEFEDDDEPQGNDGVLDGVAGSEDPAAQLLINVLHGAMSKGRQMSSKRARVRPRTRTRKRTRKT